MKKIIISLIIVVLFSSFTNTTPPLLTSDIVVVINAENPVSSMTAGEVKLMWLRKIKKRWPQLNKNIKPTDRKSKCQERETFYDKVLNMTADEVESYFIQKQYQNAEKPADKFNSDTEIIDFISNEPGAIGFVSAAAAAANKDKVKIVFSL